MSSGSLGQSETPSFLGEKAKMPLPRPPGVSSIHGASNARTTRSGREPHHSSSSSSASSSSSSHKQVSGRTRIPRKDSDSERSPSPAGPRPPDKMRLHNRSASNEGSNSAAISSHKDATMTGSPDSPNSPLARSFSSDEYSILRSSGSSATSSIGTGTAAASFNVPGPSPPASSSLSPTSNSQPSAKTKSNESLPSAPVPTVTPARPPVRVAAFTPHSAQLVDLRASSSSESPRSPRSQNDAPESADMRASSPGGVSPHSNARPPPPRPSSPVAEDIKNLSLSDLNKYANEVIARTRKPPSPKLTLDPSRSTSPPPSPRSASSLRKIPSPRSTTASPTLSASTSSLQTTHGAFQEIASSPPQASSSAPPASVMSLGSSSSAEDSPLKQHSTKPLPAPPKKLSARNFDVTPVSSASPLPSQQLQSHSHFHSQTQSQSQMQSSAVPPAAAAAAAAAGTATTAASAASSTASSAPPLEKKPGERSIKPMPIPPGKAGAAASRSTVATPAAAEAKLSSREPRTLPPAGSTLPRAPLNRPLVLPPWAQPAKSGPQESVTANDNAVLLERASHAAALLDAEKSIRSGGSDRKSPEECCSHRPHQKSIDETAQLNERRARRTSAMVDALDLPVSVSIAPSALPRAAPPPSALTLSSSSVESKKMPHKNMFSFKRLVDRVAEAREDLMDSLGHSIDKLKENVNLLAMAKQVRSAMADVFAGAAEEEAERALAAVARGSDGAHEEPHPVASGADLEARVAPLLQVLLHENQLALKTYLQVCGREDYEKVVRVASAVFLACRCSLSFLSDLVDAEIASTTQASTIFRGNTLTTAMLTAYNKRFGMEYLRRVPGPLVFSLLKSPHSFEINPMLLKPSESIETNLSHYVEFLERLLAVLYQSADFYPAFLRGICRMLQEKVRAQFPEAASSAIAGFFFLRFVCPALIAPEGFGLLSPQDTVSQQSRRNLVLVSKAIQNIANGIEFSGKEAFMQPINAIIQKHRTAMDNFLNELPAEGGEEPLEPLDAPSVSMLVSQLNNWMPKIKDALDRHSIKYEGVPLSEALQNCLRQL